MRRFYYSMIAAVGILVLSAGVVLAGGKDMLLCLPGFPGSSVQAQPYVDKVLRHLESKLGWPALSMRGVYIPDGEKALKKLQAKKPEIALVGPSIYASQHKALKMKVIAQVEVRGQAHQTFSVVTKVGGPKTLAALKGKSLKGSVVHDPKYVHNILLDGKVPDGSIKLESANRPLNALRSVARGQADAAIVSQDVVNHMKELPFASELGVIYTSKPVPPPAIVVMGEGVKHAQKLTKILVGMCKQPGGKDLCKTLTLTSIKAASDKDYSRFISSYNGR